MNGKPIATGKIIVNGGNIDSNSAIPIEIPSEAEMTALLNTAPVGAVYRYMGTSGTYENGAYYVVESEEESALITFTIDGTTYQAEEGMTWSEWVESEYNDGGFVAYADGYIATDDYNYLISGVINTETIISRNAYVLTQSPYMTQ